MTPTTADDDAGEDHMQAFRHDGPTVVTAMRGYLKVFRYRPDNDAEQASRKDAALQSGSPSFSIPRSLPFGPFIEKRFVQTERFGEADWDVLEDKLGAEIPDDLRWHIDEECERYINSVALQKQIPKWKELRDRLKKTVPAAETLFKTLTDPQRNEPIKGALSAVQTIRSYINEELTDPFYDLPACARELTGPWPGCSGPLRKLTDPMSALSSETAGLTDPTQDQSDPWHEPVGPPHGLNRFLPDLEGVIRCAKRALESAKIGAGNERQAELRLFLGTLADVAAALDVPTRLLGSYELEKFGSKEVKPTKSITFAFFRFAREVLRLATLYGAPAISKASLSPEEREAALKTLDAYANKSHRALSTQIGRKLGRAKTKARVAQKSALAPKKKAKAKA